MISLWRRVLTIAALLPMLSAQAFAQSDWKKEWERTVQEAKKEA